MSDKVFNKQQEHELCELIGNWYISLKNELIDWNKREIYIHQAGVTLFFAIDHYILKHKINHEKLLKVVHAIKDWCYAWEPVIVESFESNAHQFGRAKEELKIILCNL